MIISHSSISLQHLCVYGYIGCLPQERIVGNRYCVNLHVQGDFSQAALTDQLEHTLNYAALVQLVQKSLQQPCSLLEHAATRVAQDIFQQFSIAQQVDIELSKINPPLHADIKAASVHLIIDKE